jgi:pyruvate formate lyase activating enzyme
MKEAQFYKKFADGRVKCFLCAHNCIISDGRRGICGVRENRNGVLFTLVYGKLISVNADPIEKKPLFHFLPGSRSLSIATAGCNFRCAHCQNYDISQYQHKNRDIPGRVIDPESVVSAAGESSCESISYTYTEPTIFMEYALDCARLASERGIRNVFVSNGYTGPEAVEAIAPYLDANNIDLKGDDRFYRELCGARQGPVLDTIRMMKKLGIWVEITTLIIPGHNDSDETLKMIIDFILSIDPSIPWHVSKFYPTYKLLDSPPTPVSTLRKARETALNMGLKYVYEGNVPGEGGENTYCPGCGHLLIERVGYNIVSMDLAAGRCPACGSPIEGVWK